MREFKIVNTTYSIDDECFDTLSKTYHENIKLCNKNIGFVYELDESSIAIMLNSEFEELLDNSKELFVRVSNKLFDTCFKNFTVEPNLIQAGKSFDCIPSFSWESVNMEKFNEFVE